MQANYCIYEQLCSLKSKLKEARDNKDLAKIQEYCQRLSAIWEKLTETEKDNLIFKKHYEKNQWYYQELANEPEKLLEATNNSTQANETTPLLQF